MYVCVSVAISTTFCVCRLMSVCKRLLCARCCDFMGVCVCGEEEGGCSFPTIGGASQFAKTTMTVATTDKSVIQRVRRFICDSTVTLLSSFGVLVNFFFEFLASGRRRLRHVCSCSNVNVLSAARSASAVDQLQARSTGIRYRDQCTCGGSASQPRQCSG
jgi:hypothetical protein